MRTVSEVLLKSREDWRWELLEEMKVKLGNYIIIVPKWFITNWISFFCGRMTLPQLKAAIVHDYLYAGWVIRYEDKNEWHTFKPTRQYADHIFLEVLILVSTPIWKSMIYFLGVRAVWFLYYNKNKNGEG